MIQVRPNPRTLLGLGTLLLAMTLTSALLLLLEPGPRAPLSGIELQSLDTSGRYGNQEKLFDTDQARDWRAIVIHDSRASEGSAKSLNQAHREAGRGGLGYHFVINNGSDRKDGLVEVGFRWPRQYAGAYLTGPQARWWNEHAIGICLIGDGDDQPFTDDQRRELRWLVRSLQHRFDIPPQAVHLDLGGTSPEQAEHFNYDRFRQALANP